MNDRMREVTEAQEIGGTHLLGRGLNRMDWASGPMETKKVGDTASGRKTITYKDAQYYMGAKVDYQLATGDRTFDEIFSSSEEYQKHVEVNVEAAGSYGAFSAGFKTTFGRDISALNERSAAVHNQAVQLWRLSIPVSYDSTTQDFKEALKGLPDRFSGDNAKEFFNFFG